MADQTPRWLAAYETKSGMPDPRLAGTAAKPRHCRGCGLLVLTGYDAPLCAGLAVVDPYRLNPMLEAAAVIVGRLTYQLWGKPGSYDLTYRAPQHPPIIRLTSADECVVVAAHSCGLAPLSTIPLPTRGARSVFVFTGEVPF